ncbi:hypothetical protein EZV62_002637 [Acer yangbiense]|uniref:Uncharacterized protein n=1 Tax=Acer yangbiense TaxID=1000413 RepID=A0A5C7IY53_9ROSI|nr:hypothetical protein EZV62_002637 [Acer yangbiense]
MGVSNSEIILSDKDLNACLELNNFLTSNARRPTTTTLDQFEECRIAPPVPLQVEEENVFDKREDREQGQEQQQQQDKCRFLNLKSCDLKIKLPTKYSLAEFKVEENEDDDGVGFKTPKSPRHKISPVLECPPAPRKPKSFPLMMITKRKLPAAAAAKRRIILHDLSNEIEAMFPPVLLADLGVKLCSIGKGIRGQGHNFGKGMRGLILAGSEREGSLILGPVKLRKHQLKNRFFLRPKQQVGPVSKSSFGVWTRGAGELVDLKTKKGRVNQSIWKTASDTCVGPLFGFLYFSLGRGLASGFAAFEFESWACWKP